MMNFRPVIKEVLMMLHICGLDPFKQNLFAKFRLGVSYLFVSIVSFELSLEAIFGGNFRESLDVTIAAIGWQLMLLKVWILASYRGKIKRMIEIIQNKFWESNKYGNSLHVEIQSILKILRRILIIIITLFLCATCSYACSPELIKTRTLAFKFYHLPRNGTWIQYISVTIFQFFTVNVIGIPIYVGFDCLFASLIVYNINELKLIKTGFSQLARDGYEDDLIEIKSLYEHHILILKCIKQINNIFSLFLTNLFISHTFLVCVALLNLINNGFPPEISDVILVLLHLSMLFVCCMLGMILSAESDGVADAAYKCAWWKSHQIKLRKQLILIIQRSQKPTKLIAFKLVSLDLMTFTRIINTAFNFFTVARVVIEKFAE